MTRAPTGVRGTCGRAAVGTVALVASALQIPVGAWMLVVSSTPAQTRCLGGDVAASGCFLAGVVAAIVLLQTLGAIALGDAAAGMRRRAAILLVVVAVLMTATLTLSRKTANSIGEESTAEEPLLRGASYGVFGSGSLMASSNVPPGNLPSLISSS